MAIIRDKNLQTEWKRSHPFCFVCGIPKIRAETDRWPGLELHHIIGAAGRSDEPCNLLNLCHRCHRLCHGDLIKVDGVALPLLTRGIIRQVKIVRQPEQYDEARLRELCGFPLPELQPIPEVFEREWTLWGPLRESLE